MLIPVLTVTWSTIIRTRQQVESGGNVRTLADVTESHLCHKSESQTEQQSESIGFRNSRNSRSLKDIRKAIKYTAAQDQLS